MSVKSLYDYKIVVYGKSDVGSKYFNLKVCDTEDQAMDFVNDNRNKYSDFCAYAYTDYGKVVISDNIDFERGVKMYPINAYMQRKETMWYDIDLGAEFNDGNALIAKSDNGFIVLAKIDTVTSPVFESDTVLKCIEWCWKNKRQIIGAYRHLTFCTISDWIVPCLMEKSEEVDAKSNWLTLILKSDYYFDHGNMRVANGLEFDFVCSLKSAKKKYW